MCAMQALQGSGSAPAVGGQLGVGGQMLVAVVNPIQIAPQQQADNLDSEEFLAPLKGDDDDDDQVVYCYSN